MYPEMPGFYVSRADIEAMIEAGQPLNLSRADLSGEDLKGLNLTGATLIGANLSSANLRGVNLSSANLRGANLVAANLRYANLREANLTGANLTYAKLTGAYVSFANLTRAELNAADLAFANLTHADLSGAHLNRADVSGAHLTGANLSDANLYNANLSNANLYNARLTGADLKFAKLTGANLSDANLTGADLSSTSLIDVNLSGANLRFAFLAPFPHNVSDKNLALLIALCQGTDSEIEALLPDSDPDLDPNAYHHAALWAALNRQSWRALSYLVSHPGLSITDEQILFLKALSVGDLTPELQALLSTPELRPYTGAAKNFAAYNGHLNAFAALAKMNDVPLSSDVFWMDNASSEILQLACAISRNDPEVLDEVPEMGSPEAKAFLRSYETDPQVRAKTACVGFLFESGIPMSGEAMFALAEAAVRQEIGEAELAQLHQDGALAAIIEQTFGSAAVAFGDIQKAMRPLAVAWEVPPAFEIGLPRLVNYAAPTLTEWAALTAWRVLHEPVAPGASAQGATAARTQRWLGALGENAVERISSAVAQERAHALQQQREEQLEQRRAQQQEERGASWVIRRGLGRLAQLDRDAAALDDTTLSPLAHAARLIRTSLAEFRSAMNRHDMAEIRAACAELNRNLEKYEQAVARHLGSAQHARRVQLFGAIQDLANMPVEKLAAFDISQQLANDAKAPQRTRSARNVQRTGLER